MPTHTTVEGREFEYPDPPAAVAAFVDRAARAAADPGVSVNDMIALVYGPENPVLEHANQSGPVTPAVLANPVYRVLADLVGVKRVRAGELDPEAVRASYTLSVAEAAQRLGITVQGVRKAIDGWHLNAIYRNGQWWVRPESLAAYERTARRKGKAEAPPAVAARVGSVAGGSLYVRFEGEGELVETGRRDGAVEGTFPAGWTRALVKTTVTEAGTGPRVFEIEPADEDGEIEHRGLFVRGRFRTVKKHNTGEKAAARWTELVR